MIKADRVAVGIAQARLTPQPALIFRGAVEYHTGGAKFAIALIEVGTIKINQRCCRRRNGIDVMYRKSSRSVGAFEANVSWRAVDDQAQPELLVKPRRAGDVG